MIVGLSFLLVISSIVIALWKCECDPQDSAACTKCENQQEVLFHQKLRPFLYFVSGSSILLYLLGIFYSLRTTLRVSFETNLQKMVATSDIISEKKRPSRTDETTQWSRLTAFIVLVISLILFGLLAHKLVEVLADSSETLGVSGSFLSFPIAAFLSSSELYNIVLSAAKRDAMLATESISHYIVQILMLQIPFLTVLSGIINLLIDSVADFL